MKYQVSNVSADLTKWSFISPSNLNAEDKSLFFLPFKFTLLQFHILNLFSETIAYLVWFRRYSLYVHWLFESLEGHLSLKDIKNKIKFQVTIIYLKYNKTKIINRHVMFNQN